MKSISILIVCIITLTSSFICSNQIRPIYIKDYDIYLYPDKGCKSSYQIKINDSTRLQINLKDCKGEMYSKLYLNNLLIEEGKYVNSLVLLRKYGIGRISGRNKMHDEVIVQEFYQPLRDSIWRFYKSDTTFKIYIKGIQQ